MDSKNRGVFELIDGLSEVDPAELHEFQRAMMEEVIPEITKVLEERRLLAAESRNSELKFR